MMIRRDNNSNRSNHLTFSTFFIGENKSFRRISSRCLILNVVENVIDARKSGGNIRARKEEEEDNADDGEGKKLEQRRL